MNEMDLETKIEGLKKAIAEHEDFTGTYKSQLETVEKELKDLGKPELTPSQLDDIYEAIESGVNKFDWNDTDNFEIEYGIDYDGKVNCESHEFRNSDDLVQMILEKVSRVFTEAECPEDKEAEEYSDSLDTTEADNHPVQ